MNVLVVACLLLALLHGHQPVVAQLVSDLLPPAVAKLASDLLPPAGNSEALISPCSKATRTYHCVKGKWQLQSSFADLVSHGNSSQAVGNYTFVNNGTAVSEWHLLNSMSDLSESGFQCTVLCGKVISNGPQGQLLQISSSNLEARYSYILTRSKGGLPPHRACKGCEKVKVPFSAIHTFYTQDSVPPPTGVLALSRWELPLQSLFTSGFAKWTRVHGGWNFTGGWGSLSNCPGGMPEGSISIRPGYRTTWTLGGPYGWSVTGTSVKSVPWSPNDWPWQLYSVKSSRGSALLGKKTYVQLVSTRGGLPPKRGAAIGAIHKSPFTAISWFYTTSAI